MSSSSSFKERKEISTRTRRVLILSKVRSDDQEATAGTARKSRALGSPVRLTSATTCSPDWMSPSRIFSASGSASSFWIARFSGRAIQKLLADPLALKILEGDIQSGEHVVADVNRTGEPNALDFRAVPAVAS